MGIVSRIKARYSLCFEFEGYEYSYKRTAKGWLGSSSERYEIADPELKTTEEVVRLLEGITQDFESILETFEACGYSRH